MTHLKDGLYFVLSDIQAPLHDTEAVAATQQFIADNAAQFSGGLCVGDEADAVEVSRWAKGTADEYTGGFEAGLLSAHQVIAGYCAALNNKTPKRKPAKTLHIQRSNHTTTRINNYLLKNAPALLGTSWNDYERIMGYGKPALLDEVKDTVLPVQFHEHLYEFADGWVMAHGDEGSLSQVPGSTALGLGKRIGASVVCGHTHRLGYQHHSQGFNGKVSISTHGVEVGHLMDMSKASYLKTGAANWQQGFALLRIEDGQVYPQLVPIVNRSFHALDQKVSW